MLCFRSEKVSDLVPLADAYTSLLGNLALFDEIERLRSQGALLFSLIAYDSTSDKVLGHLAISSASLLSEHNKSLSVCALISLLSFEADLPLERAAKQSKTEEHPIEQALLQEWLGNYSDPFYQALFTWEDSLNLSSFGFERADTFRILLSEMSAEKRYSDAAARSPLYVKPMKPSFLKNASGTLFLL